MRHAKLAAALPCPIARTLEIVGEWWTLLIVRDALLGTCRFDEFKRSGISDNILSTRLKRLTKAKIFKRVRYQVSPDRYEYVLTEKGQSLAPAVLALRAWGRAWTKGQDFSEISHRNCGGNVSVSLRCEKCGEAPHAIDTAATTDFIRA